MPPSSISSNPFPPGPAHQGIPIRHLSMTAAIREQIMLHMLAAAPNEGVGLLAVDAEVSDLGRAIAARFYPGTNVDASPTRYTMDPGEVVRAVREMHARGWRWGAIVHSHLASPATPSQTDLREAYYPDVVLIIVTFQVHPAEMRAWRIDREDDLRIVRGVDIEVVQPRRGR